MNFTEDFGDGRLGPGTERVAEIESLNEEAVDQAVAALSQAEGFIEESDALAEEIADTATIEQLLDTFIEEQTVMLNDVFEVSLEGNPVRTHIELVNIGQELVELAYTLRADLIAKLANRAEVIAEQGSQLRKQVLDEESDGKGL